MSDAASVQSWPEFFPGLPMETRNYAFLAAKLPERSRCLPGTQIRKCQLFMRAHFRTGDPIGTFAGYPNIRESNLILGGADERGIHVYDPGRDGHDFPFVDLHWARYRFLPWPGGYALCVDPFAFARILPPTFHLNLRLFRDM